MSGVHAALVGISEACECAQKKIAAAIQEDAKRGAFERIEALTQSAQQIEAMKKSVDREHNRLACCSERPQFTVLIKGGAIRQSYLSVHAGMRSGLLKLDHPITVRLPNGVTLSTAAVEPGRLKARAEIGHFYKESAISEGATLRFEEASPGVWEVHSVGKT